MSDTPQIIVNDARACTFILHYVAEINRPVDCKIIVETPPLLSVAPDGTVSQVGQPRAES